MAEDSEIEELAARTLLHQPNHSQKNNKIW
jgi:hypothetical protein